MRKLSLYFVVTGMVLYFFAVFTDPSLDLSGGSAGAKLDMVVRKLTYADWGTLIGTLYVRGFAQGMAVAFLLTGLLMLPLSVFRRFR